MCKHWPFLLKFELKHHHASVDEINIYTLYLRIGFCDVRAAGAVRRAGSSQRWAGDVEHLPGRRAEVSLGLTPHVQIGGEGFYSWDSGRGRREARDVYRAADRQKKRLYCGRMSLSSDGLCAAWCYSLILGLRLKNCLVLIPHTRLWGFTVCIDVCVII